MVQANIIFPDFNNMCHVDGLLYLAGGCQYCQSHDKMMKLKIDGKC